MAGGDGEIESIVPGKICKDVIEGAEGEEEAGR